jgi:phage shock protein A
MASLLERARTLVSANLNYLVTQAMKANSMAVVDEYIRKVEDNLEALEDAAATVGGEAKTLRRKHEEYQAKAEELDRNIDLFLKEGKESLAMAAQSRLNTQQRLAESYSEQAESQEAEFQKLLDAKLKLEAKLTETRQERVELEAMLQLAKSKEVTHRTVEGVAGITTAESGLGDMREAIQKRLDKASAQGEMDSKRLDNQMSEVLEQDLLQRQLEERKKRLGMAS